MAGDRTATRRQRNDQRRQARHELGRSDAPVEDQVIEAFDTIVSEGAQRLHRRWRELLSTGLAGGFEVGTGVLAYFAVSTPNRQPPARPGWRSASASSR